MIFRSAFTRFNSSVSTAVTIKSVFAVAALGLLAGCNQNAPEERLQKIGERVESVSDQLAYLDARIDELYEELDTKKAERQKLRAQLQTLEERLEARATDVALFRAVQSALLDHSELQQTAISVDVDEGVVTLHGTVASAAERETALDTARETAGVDVVVTRIEIDSAQSQKMAKADDNS